MTGSFALAVLVSVAALLMSDGTRAAPCEACDGDSCEVKDDIRVNKLCASELCVNGTSVVTGDGNPCTSDDVVGGKAVHVPIKDCCATDDDCQQWLPDVCYTSTCTKALTDDGAQASHGYCVHEKIAGCCSCDADCPPVACKVAQCRATDAADTIFTKRSAGDAHFDRLHKGNSVLSAPGECSYVVDPARPDCCASNDDCAEGVCISGECTKLPNCEAECKVDADCQTDVMANEKCAKKGRCRANICDRGYCECKADFDKDSDKDGVCCSDDCDDNNKDLKATIWCTIANATEINRDNDTFVKCGAPVEPLCAAQCPPGRVQVNETQLDTSYIHGTKQRFVRWLCDCCDANKNSTRPDEYVYCAADRDGDNVFEPLTSPLLPDLAPGAGTGCVAQTCVLQPAGNASSETATDAVRTQQCREHFASIASSFTPAVNVSTVFFVPTEFRDNEQCDQCGDNAEEQTADKVCPKTVLFQGETYAACEVGTSIGECCSQVLDRKDVAGLPAEQEAWEKCCENIDNEAALCTSANSSFPLLVEQCECDDVPVLCRATIRCVPDKDWDGYYACKEPKEVCVDEYDAAHDADGEKEDALCRKLLGKTSHWGGYTKAFNGVTPPTEQGTFCDCDDKVPSAHELIACLKDADGDGIPASSAPFKCPLEPHAPSCSQYCAKKCPAGTIPFDFVVGDDKDAQPNCRVRGVAKRSVLDAVIAKHAGKSKCGNPRGCTDRDDEDDSDEDSDYSKTSSTDGSDDSHDKERLPRDDEPCVGITCTALDCCDKDDRVYERNPWLPVWAANGPNKCGGLDYDCDCKNETIVACPDAVSSTRGNTTLFATNENGITSTLNDAIFDEILATSVIPLGECGSTSGNCLTLQKRGWSPEVASKKRALSITLMPACTKLVKINVSGSTVTADDVATVPVEVETAMKPGYCAEWVEGCVPKSGPGVDDCAPDCEICVRLTQ